MKRPRVVTMKPRHNMRKYKDALVEEGPLTEAETKFVDELDNALGMRPRLCQTRVIQAIMNGQDVLVKSGTSSGKSLCYHALAHTKKKGCQRNATVLVIAPTIALMEDQVLLHCALRQRIGQDSYRDGDQGGGYHWCK
jgi:superfamily II DNA helicase RecQ